MGTLKTKTAKSNHVVFEFVSILCISSCCGNYSTASCPQWYNARPPIAHANRQSVAMGISACAFPLSLWCQQTRGKFSRFSILIMFQCILWKIGVSHSVCLSFRHIWMKYGPEILKNEKVTCFLLTTLIYDDVNFRWKIAKNGSFIEKNNTHTGHTLYLSCTYAPRTICVIFQASYNT